MIALPRPLYLTVNLAAYQAGWLACVLAAAAGAPGWGPAAAAALLALHLLLTPAPGRDAALALAFAAVGLAVDSLLGALGVFRFAAGLPWEWIAPPWLVAIWALFAITMHASLGWLQGRPLLAGLLGAVAGPLAYWGGSRLGAMELLLPLPAALAALAVTWGAVLPLLAALAARAEAARLRRKRGAAHAGRTRRGELPAGEEA